MASPAGVEPATNGLGTVEFREEKRELTAVASGLRRVYKFSPNESDPKLLTMSVSEAPDPMRDTLARVAEITRILSEAAEPDAVLNAVLAAMGKGVRHG